MIQNKQAKKQKTLDKKACLKFRVARTVCQTNEIKICIEVLSIETT
jgi:hypothetical protein